MPLDFPNPPLTTGQTWTASNGVTYTWDGSKWLSGGIGVSGVSSWNTRTGAVTLQLSDVTAVGGAPLASPTFTGDPQAPTPPTVDNDNSIATTGFAQAAINAAGARGNVGRNLLHNSLFNVQQRGAGPWTANGYTADRYTMNLNNDTLSVSIISLVDADRSAIGDESATYAAQLVVTGAATAGSFSIFAQSIEGVRRLSGKTMTVSFWARSSAGTPKLGMTLNQNFGTGGSPSATVVNSLGATPALTTTWTRYSLTMTLPSTAGKTLGTNNDNRTGLNFYLSDQANASGSGIGVQSGTVQLWGVQLEIGAQATPLEKPDPQQDLAKCQRFFTILNRVQWGGYAANSGVLLYAPLPLPVSMRAAPTIAFVNPSYANASGVTATQSQPTAISIYATSSAAGQIWALTDVTASADL